ncbi:hypothetical protein KDV94_21990 [Providencia rettgeri]
MYIKKINDCSSIFIDDGLVVAGFIQERLLELVEQLGSCGSNKESLVREINMLMKEYEALIECADSYNSLSTRYDMW